MKNECAYDMWNYAFFGLKKGLASVGLRFLRLAATQKWSQIRLASSRPKRAKVHFLSGLFPWTDPLLSNVAFIYGKDIKLRYK